MVSTQELKDKLVALPIFGLPFLFLLTRGPFSQQEEYFIAGTCLVIYIIMFVIWILIAVWVYRDAKERGMSGGVWVLVVLLLGIIGLIVYLVVRTDKPAYPQGAYYQQQPGYYQQPYQQPYDQQQPQQPAGEQPREYDPQTGQYK
jgi:hypothetical protein